MSSTSDDDLRLYLRFDDIVPFNPLAYGESEGYVNLQPGMTRYFPFVQRMIADR
jgi:hypothetical protein